jgi:hypothetical protein
MFALLALAHVRVRAACLPAPPVRFISQALSSVSPGRRPRPGAAGLRPRPCVSKPRRPAH